MEESVQEFKDKASKAKEELVSSFTKSIGSLPEWLRPKTTSPTGTAKAAEAAEAAENVNNISINPTATTPVGSHPELAKFNHHGRVDYSIEEALFENSYVSAIRSHFSYWDDVDVASFIAVELLSLPVKPC